jgi:hypothetical protein
MTASIAAQYVCDLFLFGSSFRSRSRIKRAAMASWKRKGFHSVPILRLRNMNSSRYASRPGLAALERRTLQREGLSLVPKRCVKGGADHRRREMTKEVSFEPVDGPINDRTTTPTGRNTTPVKARGRDSVDFASRSLGSPNPFLALSQSCPMRSP